VAGLKQHALRYPYAEDAVRALRVGDAVRLSGLLFVGRDRLHKHLAEGGACPVDLRDGGIYHCGPVALKRGRSWAITAAGPTTSIREEPYMAGIIRDYGVRLVIGKGGMGKRTLAACREHGCVYLHAVGGAACYHASCVRRVRAVHFADTFGLAEALWELEVDGLEAVVTMDSTGASLHDRVLARSRRSLRALLAGAGEG
jgi:fumarate hydratase class I